jgi:hypothetical protein
MVTFKDVTMTLHALFWTICVGMFLLDIKKNIRKTSACSVVPMASLNN